MRSASWVVRWGHTFVSAFGFGALVFFSATGIALNHPETFEATPPVEVELSGTVTLGHLQGTEVPRLEIVEELRALHGLRGRVTGFRVDDTEIAVTFAAPGYAADAWIDRRDGTLQGSELTQGAWILLNDLHKGRDAGAAWRWVIDVSAAVLIVAGVSGLWLLWYVRSRRVSGFALALVGGALFPVAYVLLER